MTLWHVEISQTYRNDKAGRGGETQGGVWFDSVRDVSMSMCQVEM